MRKVCRWSYGGRGRATGDNKSCVKANWYLAKTSPKLPNLCRQATRIGIIALSLAVSSELSKKGGYYLVPDTLHQPLEQGYVVTKRGADKPLAKQFAKYMTSMEAHKIMTKYGFVLPGEK